MSRWPRWGSYAAAAVILLVIGAALRPVVLPEKHTAAPVLDATDIGFTQDMTAHHQQAIQMVQCLDPAVDPQVLRLAQQIDQSQRAEIGTMLGWLRLANAAPMSDHPMAWMQADTVAAHDHAASGPATTAPVATMPGTASTAELDRLSTARGRDAEVLFLQLMYRHHQGGIAMARAADQRIASGPVKEQARAMLVAQSQETGLMALMLNQRGAQPLP
ncbi:DUF305 domain-containing protein [Nocardia nova]|uniref:DUF305 domain-containing protein n=1 Tax=Nocardia nova TaxID=37330 RepID=A0A2S6AVW3_9NOCA|nr:DUF305 domain-containing protein [Nocardia nova]PPJ33581.1 DUF305 domain-containing protein [Nocardia nova]PPJ39376.1 DUF305 domain-containing protein [Nocardia nova]